MKKYILQLMSIVTLVSPMQIIAGNPDRSGGAGGTQLLINPYGRSAGMLGANTASVRGIESFNLNIGGLAYTNKTEISFSNVTYLQGTDVFINNLSIAQNLGGGNVLGLTINSFDFGSIPITSVSQPDATLGTYSPQVLNIGAAFSKKFSNSITGGINVRIISEGISSVTANGIGLDAGVQYQTTLNGKNLAKKAIKKEDFRFGISVRNIGPNMQYSGSGLSFRSINPTTGADRRALMGSETFNLPALVHIGAAYDMRLDDKATETYNHRLTLCGNFNYNAFSANVTTMGLEYAFKEMLMLRGGFAYQENVLSEYSYQSQYLGFAGGVGFVFPVSKSGTALAINYAYAPTRVFNGIHNLTIALNIDSKK
ncbi:MAG: PorV/PorQ family protein [Bacteroidia bacterium]|nr:PorV/PorQ family protein [Bacteroidia bacterium]MCC7532404.1 PorV/PorQ family protein [Bacteroidia bacterium]MCZ2141360.1 PorV/PorQ family protein [Bacteroidia bacterium]